MYLALILSLQYLQEQDGEHLNLSPQNVLVYYM